MQLEYTRFSKWEHNIYKYMYIYHWSVHTVYAGNSFKSLFPIQCQIFLFWTRWLFYPFLPSPTPIINNERSVTRCVTGASQHYRRRAVLLEPRSFLLTRSFTGALQRYRHPAVLQEPRSVTGDPQLNRWRTVLPPRSQCWASSDLQFNRQGAVLLEFRNIPCNAQYYRSIAALPATRSFTGDPQC